MRGATRDPEDRSLLEAFASAPNIRAGLTRAALLLARTACNAGSADAVEARLDTLAADVRRTFAAARTATERAAAIGTVLSRECGSGGAFTSTAPDDTAPDDTAPDDTAPDDTAPDDDFAAPSADDARLSCPHCALETGQGLPLTLALVWMGVGRRAGWQVEGVGFPGHFLVRVFGAGGGTVLVDPVEGGRVLGLDDARSLLESLNGGPSTLRPEHLRSLEPRDILLRMLRNLRACWLSRGDQARSLAVAEDMLLLAPGLPEAHRDRGFLRLEDGDRSGAVDDLRRFVNGAEDPRRTLRALRLLHHLTDAAEMPN